jgi:ribosomal-protein-alanine N-acetyltransferase
MTGPGADGHAKAKVRPMRAADLEQVISIAASLPNAPRWPQSAYANALNPDSTPRRIALVIVPATADPVSNAVLGFTVASLLAPQAELETIAVAPSSQRCGLGRQLFHALARELAEAGNRELALEVRASNWVALAFYRSLGFEGTGLRPRYYIDPQEDAVMMKLALG